MIAIVLNIGVSVNNAILRWVFLVDVVRDIIIMKMFASTKCRDGGVTQNNCINSSGGISP